MDIRPVLFLAALGLTHTVGAQPRPPVRGPIAVTLPAPTPPAPASPERFRHQPDILPGWVGGWNLPLMVQSSPVVQQVPTPYPVPYYVPVPVSPRRPDPPRPEPTPYDPSKASMVMIGSGADGGAGVLRWQPAGRDSLRVTWLGALRPVRDARAVVTDSLHVELVSQPVSVGTPVTLRVPRQISHRAVYVGIAVTHSDGSRMTTLVPLASR